jgi:hypothetical protein
MLPTIGFLTVLVIVTVAVLVDDRLTESIPRPPTRL